MDKYTTQHTKYANIFALGDASSLPTSKTMAAITGQAPVLTHNLLRVMAGRPASAQVSPKASVCMLRSDGEEDRSAHMAPVLHPAQYDGFTSCPIVLGYDKLLMTEFKYDCIPAESFTNMLPIPIPFLDQGKVSPLQATTAGGRGHAAF